MRNIRNVNDGCEVILDRHGREPDQLRSKNNIDSSFVQLWWQWCYQMLLILETGVYATLPYRTLQEFLVSVQYLNLICSKKSFLTFPLVTIMCRWPSLPWLWESFLPGFWWASSGICLQALVLCPSSEICTSWAHTHMRTLRNWRRLMDRWCRYGSGRS